MKMHKLTAESLKLSLFSGALVKPNQHEAGWRKKHLLGIRYTSSTDKLRGNLMECKVHWVEGAGMAFLAETGSGHAVVMDGSPDGGGRNLAPRPMEMVLLGTGGCTAYDVVLILKRAREQVQKCEVSLKAERAGEDPKVFTQIHFHFKVTGKNLKPATVERAVQLSHDKYCSASIMLAKTAGITHSVEIVEV